MVADGERWVAAENIRRFQAKFQEAKDEAERRILRDLIKREEEKLFNAARKGEGEP